LDGKLNLQYLLFFFLKKRNDNIMYVWSKQLNNLGVGLTIWLRELKQCFHLN
jgi:hypothetical protein